MNELTTTAGLDAGIVRDDDAVGEQCGTDARTNSWPVLNCTGFVGGLIPREDYAHGPTKQVLSRAS
jgi:hypothetical protein